MVILPARNCRSTGRAIRLRAPNDIGGSALVRTGLMLAWAVALCPSLSPLLRPVCTLLQRHNVSARQRITVPS